MINKNWRIIVCILGAMIIGSCAPKRSKDFPNMKSAEVETELIKKRVLNVNESINTRDQQRMISNYVSHGNALLIGPSFSAERGEYGNREQYVKMLWQMFENLKSFKSTPNDDIKVKIFDNVANVTLTGRNDAVDTLGRKGSAEWLWTMQMEKVGDEWLIRNDNLKFFSTESLHEINGIDALAKCCLASITPNIRMNELGLNMSTEFPVEWYSKVETIPPVNYTASVSLTPTPLISDGREVGRLLRGIVKFREVVYHEKLEGKKGLLNSGESPVVQ